MLNKLRQAITPPAVEQRSIQLAGTPVTYTLKRSGKRRSIGLRIDDRGLTVSMPSGWGKLLARVRIRRNPIHVFFPVCRRASLARSRP